MNSERIVLSNVISISAAVGSQIMRNAICIFDLVHVQTMKKGNTLLILRCIKLLSHVNFGWLLLLSIHYFFS
jgi:hypothetical protein